MATHTSHADISEGGLVDDCPRCDEHAKSIVTLDALNLAVLWHRMIEVEYGDSSYRSANEAKAGKQLYLFSLIIERFGQDPRTIFEDVYNEYVAAGMA